VSLREKIQAADRKLVPLVVAEWGETVYLRSLSVADRLAVADAFEGMTPEARVARLVRLSVHDAAGVPVWTEADEPAIALMDGAALSEIGAEVRKLNKFNQSTDEATAEKNG
jgi:hypothetical protein